VRLRSSNLRWRGDGGEKVGRLGVEVHLHLADGFDNDTGEGAAPSGVNGGDSALFGVDEENGDAIGGLDGEEQAGAVGDGGVALADLGRGGVEKMDDVGMDLLQGDEFQVVAPRADWKRRRFSRTFSLVSQSVKPRLRSFWPS